VQAFASTARAAIALLCACGGVTLAVPTVAVAHPLALGFFDPDYATPSLGPELLQRTAQAGGDIVRIDIGWRPPRRPAAPRDPADPTYDFNRADAAIRTANAQGLKVLVSFTGAPPWAEGPGRPAWAQPGTWRPDPAAIADYGAALARRYSGTFPDPLKPGSSLPRVTAFQAWNEPNLSTYLTPQWAGASVASASHYRAMLNAFYFAVKSVAPQALVVTAGTAPYGDPAVGAPRVRPARFWRAVLCQRRRGRHLRAAPCPNPAHFDVLSHHPYPSGSPRSPAAARDDIAIADMGKLKRILRAAQRTGRALPSGPRKRLWVTEISYDSAPEDPNGVPERLHARYVAETFYLLWRAGVDTITWFRILDAAPIPSYGETNQSGIFGLDRRPKLADRAFRFPFVAERAGRRGLRVWGRSPVAGRVKIERLRAGRWRRVGTVAARRHGTFLLRIAAGGRHDRLRARIGSEISLTWRR
jgi:hypothetical protein